MGYTGSWFRSGDRPVFRGHLQEQLNQERPPRHRPARGDRREPSSSRQGKPGDCDHHRTRRAHRHRPQRPRDFRDGRLHPPAHHGGPRRHKPHANARGRARGIRELSPGLSTDRAVELLARKLRWRKSCCTGRMFFALAAARRYDDSTSEEEGSVLEVAIMVEGQEGVGWDRWRRLALAVEELGYAGLYRSDHLPNKRMGMYRDGLELWSSLAWPCGEYQPHRVRSPGIARLVPASRHYR